MKNKKIRLLAVLTAMSLAASPLTAFAGEEDAESVTEKKPDTQDTESAQSETTAGKTDSTLVQAGTQSGTTQSDAEKQSAGTETSMPNSETESNERQLIMIGDSRTVYMHEAVGDDGQIWSCKGGIGQVWMKGVGVPAVEKYIGSDTNVVILMGINDAWIQTTDPMTTVYADYLNKKAEEWTAKGANVFFVSVNPVRQEWGNNAVTLTNEGIEKFNSEMRAKLNYSIHYIDTYSQIRSSVQFVDALHFTPDTNKKIYSLIKEECANYKTDKKQNERTSGDFSNYFYTSNTEEQKTAEKDMYRLYNPNSGEHFYTGNAGERDHLQSVGWTYEGIGWKSPVKSNTPVYRLYNPNSGLHHYTMNQGERNTLIGLGWRDEGIGWYSDDCRRNIVYREYNPNSGQHNYTTSRLEHAYLMSLGWHDESYGWFSA